MKSDCHDNHWTTTTQSWVHSSSLSPKIPHHPMSPLSPNPSQKPKSLNPPTQSINPSLLSSILSNYVDLVTIVSSTSCFTGTARRTRRWRRSTLFWWWPELFLVRDLLGIGIVSLHFIELFNLLRCGCQTVHLWLLDVCEQWWSVQPSHRPHWILFSLCYSASLQLHLQLGEHQTGRSLLDR